MHVGMRIESDEVPVDCIARYFWTSFVVHPDCVGTSRMRDNSVSAAHVVWLEKMLMRYWLLTPTNWTKHMMPLLNGEPLLTMPLKF